MIPLDTARTNRQYASWDHLRELQRSIIEVQIQPSFFASQAVRQLVATEYDCAIVVANTLAKVHASLIRRDLIRELSVVGFSPSIAAAPFAP